MKKTTKKRKDPAAVKLGLRSVATRMTWSPAKRSAQARMAAASRWDRQKPVAAQVRWYGLFDDTNLDHPELVAYSQNKTELRQRAQSENRPWTIEALDYDPRTRIPIVAKFVPDGVAQGQALEDLQRLDTNRKGRR